MLPCDGVVQKWGVTGSVQKEGIERRMRCDVGGESGTVFAECIDGL